MSENSKETSVKLSAEAFKVLARVFPPEQISKLKKKYKDKQGNWQEFELDYVGHADVTRRLLEADPEWNWSPVAYDPLGVPLVERTGDGFPCGMWIHLTVCGVTRLGYGSCQQNATGSKDHGDALKELIGDAIRNAAMRFGVALQLWSKTKEGDVTFQPAERPARAPARRSASAGSERNSPAGSDPEPSAEALAPDRDDNYAQEVANAFGGSLPDPIPGRSGPVKVLGVNIPADKTLEQAMNYLLTFGKHKGKTLGDLTKDGEGRHYLEWLAQKTATDIREGKRKIYPSDYLTLLAYDSFQSTAPVPPDAGAEGWSSG